VAAVRIGARDDDEQIADLAVRDVRLRAVQQPVVAFVFCACLDAREIAAGPGLGHRDAEDRLAGRAARQDA
jgi:hypothetical protein